MTDSSLDEFVSAILNNTRREILRCLTLDESYALRISRLVGISQQAVIKQLDLLERANLIESVGTFPSELGASRKIYRPRGFSTLVADYSRNFIDIRKYEIPVENKKEEIKERSDLREFLSSLIEINSDIENLMTERSRLIAKKDHILANLHDFIVVSVNDRFARELLLDYVDTLDYKTVSEENSVPEDYVRSLVKTYLS
ncbi:MAG: helix-turn-helix domain-containing protein [Thermoplasmatales archaeon]|nr:helix-turn-helix domain-containing protein [Thermoplasmatales archaeon]MCW6170890.1 helix-turn-helix domain-containing protein [Thermoplasmatales archaeon]